MSRRTTSSSGLSSVELLSLPGEQGKIARWLTRRKQATFSEIQAAVAADPAEVRTSLQALIDAGAISEAQRDGEVFYRVQFKAARERAKSSYVGGLLDRVNPDTRTFLRQMPLFRELTNDHIEQIAGLFTERDYQRDDVLLWQGQTSDYVYLIKSGIVGISRFSKGAAGGDSKILAYLKQMDMLGDINALRAGTVATATATATALSAVTVLLLKKTEFLDLLYSYPAVAVELTRLMAQRLVNSETRSSRSSSTRVCLLINFTGSDISSLGGAQALALNAATQRSTVYAELPDQERLRTHFPATANQIVSRVGEVDVMLDSTSSGLVPSLRMTIDFDYLSANYEQLVITIDHRDTEIVGTLAPSADQIVLVAAPTLEAWQEVTDASADLRTQINPEKVGVFTAMYRPNAESAEVTFPWQMDFELPYMGTALIFSELSLETLPAPLAQMAKALADRLGRTNQVSIFIPTTIDVNTEVDTSLYVDRTLAFLGERFGGATTNQARGVWNSADAGLVGESIHIVRSYATQGDLDRHLREILDYVETLKTELRQEAMAVEINQKLMLI